jgi:hypothetical protein
MQSRVRVPSLSQQSGLDHLRRPRRRGFGLERDAADSVDDQQRNSAEHDEFVLQAARVVGIGEAARFGGGGEQGAVPGLTGADPDPDRQLVFPVPGGPKNNVVSCSDDIQGPKVRDRLPLGVSAGCRSRRRAH